MTLLPNVPCPKCKGRITFFDVMGIVTPFQYITCATCGEMVFLKNRWGVLIFSIVFGLTVTLIFLGALVGEWATDYIVYAVALGIIIAVEFLVTGYVVVKRKLVVRRSS